MHRLNCVSHAQKGCLKASRPPNVNQYDAAAKLSAHKTNQTERINGSSRTRWVHVLACRLAYDWWDSINSHSLYHRFSSHAGSWEDQKQGDTRGARMNTNLFDHPPATSEAMTHQWARLARRPGRRAETFGTVRTPSRRHHLRSS